MSTLQTIQIPEMFAFLKRQKPLLGTRLSALIHLLKEELGYAISPCKRKTVMHASFNWTGVKFALYFLKINYKKLCKSLSIIVFKGYCVRTMIRIL